MHGAEDLQFGVQTVPVFLRLFRLLKPQVQMLLVLVIVLKVTVWMILLFPAAAAPSPHPLTILVACLQPLVQLFVLCSDSFPLCPQFIF